MGLPKQRCKLNGKYINILLANVKEQVGERIRKIKREFEMITRGWQAKKKKVKDKKEG